MKEQRIKELDAALAKVRNMTARQLVEFAYEQLGLELKVENGRPWLVRKVGYALTEKIKGPLEGKAADRAKDLDKPEVIAEYQKEAEIEASANQGGSKMSDSTKKEKKVVNYDEHGFRADSKTSKGFDLLLKGVDGKTFKKVVGECSAGSLMGSFRLDPKDSSTGRAANILRTRLTTGDNHYQILSYKDKDGKVHKVEAKMPEDIAINKKKEFTKKPSKKAAKAEVAVSKEK